MSSRLTLARNKAIHRILSGHCMICGKLPDKPRIVEYDTQKIEVCSKHKYNRGKI